tara:strand:+ start:612 stop:1157 length:546 start_codon:yes stop_codon:yes gene_type:complete
MLLLLDRDGVLNEERRDYVKEPRELHLIPGSANAVAELCLAGYRIVVVTNQSCVGRGIISEGMLAEIHRLLKERVAKAGGRIDAILHCPDPPWAPTERRKPGVGMLREALSRFCVSPEDTPMIGDSLVDLQAAAAIGCPRILVRTGSGAETEASGIPPNLSPIDIYPDLASAARELVGKKR